MKDFFETVMKRTSVRRFSEAPLSKETWERLLRAAMAAPSAVNSQPWEFIVVSDREKLKALADVLPYAKMTASAAGALVACAVPKRAFGGSRDFAIIDTSLACENFLLAVEALGLGAVWTALFPDSGREKAVRGLLGIPEEIIPLALIPVGLPEGEGNPKDKYRKEFIHLESW
jgi:nitroreductase